jgi:hypothetical protein
MTRTETPEFNRHVNTLIMRGLSASDARREAERCEAAGCTGKHGLGDIEYGETFTDDHGVRWHQVFEYENGECVDRYVTKVGVQL